MVDPKQGEREYYARLDANGIAHSLGKPFSDQNCGHYLASMAALFSLLDPPPRRIVEFGCGTGWLSLFLAQRGYDVLGIDISTDAVAHARADAAARGITRARFEACDYESFAEQGFDYAVFHDSLHHAESELDALRCAYSALTPQGCVITFEPGSGHHATEAARAVVELYGVHEKSMPPAHIVRTGKAAGFRRHLVLPQPHEHHRLIYRPGYQHAGSTADLRGRWALSVLRSLRNLLRRCPDPGVVLLWK